MSGLSVILCTSGKYHSAVRKSLHQESDRTRFVNILAAAARQAALTDTTTLEIFTPLHSVLQYFTFHHFYFAILDFKNSNFLLRDAITSQSDPVSRF